MDIPEKAQADALAKVDELGRKRASLLAQAQSLLPELQKAAVRAAQLGASRSRIHQLTRMSPGPVYRWFDEAGLPKVRGKKDKDGDKNA
ncbi:hypothetical protein ACWGCC_37890 [Streptomyces nigrescens]